ncbi:MAG: aldo/keto reductase family oxidoreductase [Bacteroidota bacterium]|jgi:predicted oxidoreductase
MEKIFISETGPEVSAAIYGFWRWNTSSLLSQKKIEDIIHYNLELGVNTFDHSNNYSNGKIEELFGKAISQSSIKRENIIISTKAGIRQFSDKHSKGEYYDLSPEYITKSVEDSLKRLNTDYIDIFLLEHYDPLYAVEETASALIKLLRSGKIKNIGVSNFNVFQHRTLASNLTQPIVTNHIELNLLQSFAIDDGRLDFIKEQFSKPMAYAPLAGGRILNGKDAKAIKVRKVLTEIAKKHAANIEQVAVAWLFKLGAFPIIGSPDKKRIKNAASSYTIKLSNEEWYKLYNATK